ncbi:MAG: segregation/condensation protein A [Chloroflexota bacterium]|nr:segregation/condensation protein A [Chloroflexota bacterium]
MMEVIYAPGSDYTIHTELYVGPLGLLLDLITKAELDITRLSLTAVTDQYLEHLGNLQHYSAVEVSGFLVVAAKLLQIKSEALLPRPTEREEGEEDPAISLARQLKIYRKIKQTAQWLKSLADKGKHTYIRLAPPPLIENELDLQGATINDLLSYFKALYQFEEDAAPITTVVAIPIVTIKNKIRDLIQSLRKGQELSYKRLLPEKHNRIEAIVLFLAVLELVKQQYASAEQDTLFADFKISPTEKTFKDSEINLALEE